MRTRHNPVRTCVSCRTSGEKRGLLRVVRQPDGLVVYDMTGKSNGRGAYVCAESVCIALAKKQKKLDRSLKVEVPAEIFDRLLARVAQSSESPGSAAQESGSKVEG